MGVEQSPQPEPGGNTPLDGARRRRLALQDAMALLERVAAAPAGATRWRDRVQEALVQVDLAVRDHIEEVEQTEGLLTSALEVAPRVAPLVDRLRTDHDRITRAVSDLSRRLQAPAEELDVAAARRRVLALLGMLTEHRQRGSDLVYEAYDVDIGGG